MNVLKLPQSTCNKHAEKVPNNTLEMALIGVPCDVGTDIRGCSLGPQALRLSGLPQALTDLGAIISDRGDISGPAPQGPEQKGGCRNLESVSSWCRLIQQQVASALQENRLPVIIGGDHSLSMGSITAVAQHCRHSQKPLFVLWLDAHTDFNNPMSSPSGNMHGMPLSALCGKFREERLGLGDKMPVVEPQNIFLVGIRSVDTIEKLAVIDAGLNVYDMRVIDEKGIASVIREILQIVTQAGGHLHVSFDIDFLDPSLAPGVGTTVAGGVTYREAHHCMELIYESGLLGSLELVEYNPLLDNRGMSARIMIELTESLFGKQTINLAR